MSFILIAIVAGTDNILGVIRTSIRTWYDVIYCKAITTTTISTLQIPFFLYLLPPYPFCFSGTCSLEVKDIGLGIVVQLHKNVLFLLFNVFTPFVHKDVLALN